MGDRYDVAVIGGGLVGLATAYQLLEARPSLGVVVLEKETELARHQSGRNSGVIHAGLSYRPGSLKARLCRAGKAELEAFASDNGVPHRRCGKLIVAVREPELRRLEELRDRAAANRVPVEEVGPERIRELEPHATGIRALHSPSTGIIDFARIALALASRIRSRGGSIITGGRVETIRRGGAWRVLETGRDEVAARRVIACAGLHADRVASMSGAAPRVRIVPFRGSYFVLRPEARRLATALIYPVPDPALPFLGVHFTRRMDGGVWVGPNAVLALAREGYSWSSISVRDLAGTLSFPGTWRVAGRLLGVGVSEVKREILPRLLVRELRRYVPELGRDDLLRGPSGVRAQAVDRRGRLVDDFVFADSGGITHVLNAPSPAATACLAIGRLLAARVDPEGGSARGTTRI